MSCTSHPDADRTPQRLVAVITNYSDRRGQPTRYEDVYCLPCSMAWLRKRTLATDLQAQAEHALAGRP